MLKMMVHLERETTHLVETSYAFETHYAYHMGENVLEYMTDEQQMAQSWLIELFHKTLSSTLRIRLFSGLSLSSQYHKDFSHVLSLIQLSPLSTRKEKQNFIKNWNEAEKLYMYHNKGYFGLNFVQFTINYHPDIYQAYIESNLDIISTYQPISEQKNVVFFSISSFRSILSFFRTQ